MKPVKKKIEGAITIGLSNNQALHLWSITVDYIEEKTRWLKMAGVFKGDGSRNLRKKYISDYHQEILDNLELAKLINKHIEATADFSEIELEVDNLVPPKTLLEESNNKKGSVR